MTLPRGAWLPVAALLVAAVAWGSTVVYAGVVEDSSWDETSQQLTVQSKEFRASLVPARMLFGVVDYQADAVALSLTGRSYSSAVRRLITAAMAPSSEWVLPVDVASLSDSAGGFSAVWRKEEKLTWEDCLAQIEADGCEVFFRPYLSAGLLRWEPLVAATVLTGGPVDLAARAPGSRVVDLTVKWSTARLATGVLGFGKGQGQDAPSAYAPTGGSGASSQPVRDVVVTFPDVSDPGRLQAATTAEYESRRLPVEQWAYGLHVWPDGPAIALPGMVHRLWVYGSGRLADGAHDMRVIALSGDMGFKVTPEVQSAG